MKKVYMNESLINPFTLDELDGMELTHKTICTDDLIVSLAVGKDGSIWILDITGREK